MSATHAVHFALIHLMRTLARSVWSRSKAKSELKHNRPKVLLDSDLLLMHARSELVRRRHAEVTMGFFDMCSTKVSRRAAAS